MYLPAVAFEQPLAEPATLNVETFSLAELMSIPAAWEIVGRHLPSLTRMAGGSMIKPHLGNFTVYTVQTFAKGATPETIAAINEELRRLPPVETAR